MKKELTRKQKIKLIEHVYENGYNELLFKEPVSKVFFQELHNPGFYESEGILYSEEELIKIEDELYKINKYLKTNQIQIHDKQHMIVVVKYKEGKTIL
jgi:hypothetical protein